eukprot:TRINITY_DN6964_c0_g1_i1.p1 TRINITY_DN6964_c0_g1~~TRINITY_DN6964_c0_g1_i1.p1  ORF type:complete len:799 (-),score=226.83 TRINITY_DN6964_c0_g1_i1:157-2553(-)
MSIQILIGKHPTQFIITHEICSTVYGGENIDSKEEVAIKIEERGESSRSKLKRENSYYDRLGDGDGFVKRYFFEIAKEYNVMVMDRLGPTLEFLLSYCDGKFSIKTTLMLVDQLITRLEFIHSRGIIYGDINPHNFLTEGKDGKGIIYIVSFGLARTYIDEKDQHVVLEQTKSFGGSLNFASRSAHLRRTLSRRDDLESLGYLIIYFLTGQLPWLRVKAASSKEVRNIIGKLKLNTNFHEFCQKCDISRVMIDYFEYVEKLDFEEKPNYDLMRKIFKDVADEKNIEYDNVYDWVEQKYSPKFMVYEEPKMLLVASNKKKRGMVDSKYVTYCLQQMELLKKQDEKMTEGKNKYEAYKVNENWNENNTNERVSYNNEKVTDLDLDVEDDEEIKHINLEDYNKNKRNFIEWYQRNLVRSGVSIVTCSFDGVQFANNDKKSIYNHFLEFHENEYMKEMTKIADKDQLKVFKKWRSTRPSLNCEIYLSKDSFFAGEYVSGMLRQYLSKRTNIAKFCSKFIIRMEFFGVQFWNFLEKNQSYKTNHFLVIEKVENICEFDVEQQKKIKIIPFAFRIPYGMPSSFSSPGYNLEVKYFIKVSHVPLTGVDSISNGYTGNIRVLNYIPSLDSNFELAPSGIETVKEISIDKTIYRDHIHNLNVIFVAPNIKTKISKIVIKLLQSEKLHFIGKPVVREINKYTVKLKDKNLSPQNANLKLPFSFSSIAKSSISTSYEGPGITVQHFIVVKFVLGWKNDFSSAQIPIQLFDKPENDQLRILLSSKLNKSSNINSLKKEDLGNDFKSNDIK